MDAVLRPVTETDPTATEDNKLPNRPSRAEAEAAARVLLQWIGDDPEREGLLDTPKRVIKAYEDLFFWIQRRSSRASGTYF